MSIQQMSMYIESFFAERNSSWDDPRWKTPKSPGSRRAVPPTSRDGSQESQPRPTTSSTNQPRREPSDQAGGRDIQCFACNKKGHFARSCPDRVSRVNRVLQGKQNFILDAEVNGEPTKALVDSGAQATVIPAHLVPPSAYTNSTWNAAGLISEGPLPIATVTISIAGTASRMNVLVKEGLKEVLLGQDYPELKQLLSKGMVTFMPLTGILGPADEVKDTQTMTTEMSLAEEAEDSRKGMGMYSLAEEAEGMGMYSLEEEAEDLRKEMEMCSPAEEAEDYKEEMEMCGLAEVEDAREAQREDDSLDPFWEAAEDEKDGYVIKGQTLYHWGKDEWDEDTLQLVIPTKFHDYGPWD